VCVARFEGDCVGYEVLFLSLFIFLREIFGDVGEWARVRMYVSTKKDDF
jgi:hypothetical protein